MFKRGKRQGRWSRITSRNLRYLALDFMTRVKNRGITIHQDYPLSCTSTYTIHYAWTEHLVNEGLGRVAMMLRHYHFSLREMHRNQIIHGKNDLRKHIKDIDAAMDLHGVNYPRPDISVTGVLAAYELMQFMLRTVGDVELRNKILNSKVYKRFTKTYIDFILI